MSINYGLFRNHNDLQGVGRHGALPFHPVASDGQPVDPMSSPFIDFLASAHAGCHFVLTALTQPVLGISLSSVMLLTSFGLGNQITHFVRFLFKVKVKHFNQ